MKIKKISLIFLIFLIIPFTFAVTTIYDKEGIGGLNNITSDTNLSFYLNNSANVGFIINSDGTDPIIGSLNSNTIRITDDINSTGNITANYYFGNGSQLTGIATTETDPHFTGNFSNIAFTNINELFDENVSVVKNFSVDGKTLFINSNSDGVGVNTTTPSSPHALNVIGDVNFTNNLVVAEDVLYVDAVNRKLGMGTNTPAANLHLNSEATAGFFRFQSGTKYWQFAAFPGGALTIQEGAAGNAERLRFLGGGNIGMGTATPGYPLEINGSSGASNISLYTSHNISATGFITRTSVFDKSKEGSIWDYIQDADYYKNDNLDSIKFITGSVISDTKKDDFETQEETINHSKFYGYTFWETNDTSKPIIVSIEGTNETEEHFPFMKTVEGVNLGSELDLLRQAVYLLKEENDQLKIELCQRDNTYSWCGK